MGKHRIAVARGDGIGPEIMQATLHVLEAAGAALNITEIVVGEKLYHQGYLTGMDPKMWDVLREVEAFLKAPITTPQGGGYRSLNVAIRTTLGLYANIRPCVSYFPFVATKHPEMDVVIVRENEEDLYMGIEYRQTPHMAHSLKIISEEGSERIIRYAFAYARATGRKKVSCFIKDNIMKLSDGLFHRVFQRVSQEYSDLLNDSWIVDIGAARLADTPEIFDVIVMPNLYGDILSDVAAQIAGSVGLAGSANIGDGFAMFEAIHGSAPKRSGQNVANPSGLLLAAIQMLVYLHETHSAELIHNAWLCTLEEGIHTYDLYKEGVSKKKVGTQEFAEAVIRHLGKRPQQLPPVAYSTHRSFAKELPLPPRNVRREIVGVDLYIYHLGQIGEFIDRISHINIGALHLKQVMNRGASVWPQYELGCHLSEQWRCRFLVDENHRTSQAEVLQVIQAADRAQLDVIKTEHLYKMDGTFAFSL